MKNATKIIGAAALVAALTGCSSINTAPDQAGLHYSGGSWSSTSFKNCVLPSTQDFDGPGDKHYVYPNGQRTYKFSPDRDADDNSIKAVSMDNVQMAYSGVVTFKLKTDCKTLQQFHEQVGLKDWGGSPAYVNDSFKGWNAMLRTYLGGAVQRAVNEAAASYGYKSLYNDNTARAKAEAEVQKKLPAYVKQLAGADYFTDFNVTLQKPEAPANIVKALEAEQEAVAQNNAQKKQNETARTQYQTFDDCMKAGLSQQSCITIWAIKTGNVKVLPIPQGSSIIVDNKSVQP